MFWFLAALRDKQARYLRFSCNTRFSLGTWNPWLTIGTFLARYTVRARGAV